jgi:hypothetical protein
MMRMPLRKPTLCVLLLLALTSAPGCISSEMLADKINETPTAEELLAEAKVTWRKKDSLATEKILRELLRLDPEHLDARIAMADVYRRMAHESRTYIGTEPPAAIAQLEYVAERRPDSLYLARRLMEAYVGSDDELTKRKWALKVAQLDNTDPVGTRIVLEALFENRGWEQGEPLLRRYSRMRRVRPLLVLNLWVQLARGQKDLPKIEQRLAEYLKAVAFRTHLDWVSLPEEDLPRLMAVLEAVVEVGTDVETRESRLAQTLTIIDRLRKTEVGLPVTPWLLDRLSLLILKTDELNQEGLISEVVADRVERQMLDNRRRSVEIARKLPEEFTLKEETLDRVSEIESRLVRSE